MKHSVFDPRLPVHHHFPLSARPASLLPGPVWFLPVLLIRWFIQSELEGKVVVSSLRRNSPKAYGTCEVTHARGIRSVDALRKNSP